jgi:hypothetical protein
MQKNYGGFQNNNINNNLFQSNKNFNSDGGNQNIFLIFKILI